MSSDISSVCQQRDQPSSQMAEGDSTSAFRYRFLEKFQQRPENTSSQQSIYRIPSLLKELDPNAYEPRVVSIGPYHHGKEQLQAMEEHKHRALNRFLNINDGISFDGILAEFRETSFSAKVRNCYTEPLEPQWDDDVLSRLMVLDGCFLLELLLEKFLIRDPSSSINGRPEKHALLSYMKMDMLVLDNQIPLLVLRKLASIIAKLVSNRPSTSEPTGSENVAIQVEEPVEEQVEEPVENQNITKLIWKFFGTMNDEIPADDAHHLLDAYWRKGCIGTGDYDGWATKESAEELYYLGVRFQQSSGGSFKDVKFDRADNIFIRYDRFLYSDQSQNGQAQQNHQNNQNGQAQRLLSFITAVFRRCILSTWLFLTCWWWRITFWVAEGMFSLPHLTIDGTTGPTLLNLMDFELLHLRNEETHPVTDYVLLMASLVRSQNDAELLRTESILSCSPGWTNESVVKLFADLTRNVVFNGTRKTNKEIDALCKRRSNRVRSKWRRRLFSLDTKTRVAVFLTLYGLGFTAANTYFSVIKYFDDKKHQSVVN